MKIKRIKLPPIVYQYIEFSISPERRFSRKELLDNGESNLAILNTEYVLVPNFKLKKKRISNET